MENKIMERFIVSNNEKELFNNLKNNYLITGKLFKKDNVIYKYKIYFKDNKINYQVKKGNKIVIDTKNIKTLKNKILKELKDNSIL